MKQNENQRISNHFGGFCSKVLKNESRSIHAIYARQRKRETSLTELSREELLQLSAEDKYFNNIHIFKVMDKEIVVVGNMLAKALAQLPPEKLNVILLSYFMNMTDAEIGLAVNAIQQTVNKRRKSTLKLLRDYFEKEGLEWDDM